MSTVNLFKRLVQLLPDEPVLTGRISAVHGDGTATVDLPGNGRLRVRNPLGSQEGGSVYVQGQAITGEAPQLTYVLIDI
ncbi:MULTISPECIES: hypothetical protein [Pseudomonadota]|uniref:Uncharacterized protein n=1 Tax=Delftia acidovorans TaxID=80866 RepID=A0AAJ2QYP5_DELAC|nr:MULTISPECIES: hypothetical protein [Pseudomonadota]AEF91018.1 hypothetical protein DelCs14_4033 [Delftia sp. Cs1-4]KZK28430.1 hypothetical protein A4F85_11625 [Delftia sp. GW456-R20]MBO0990095.1 hypothetical protein [Delftia sp. SD083]MBO1034861.1 hypothetical protein [Delftia sp. SD018]MCG3783970.1 hypothetical protein [Delftia acidovorans]